jgi:hypothetical protein
MTDFPTADFWVLVGTVAPVVTLATAVVINRYHISGLKRDLDRELDKLPQPAHSRLAKILKWPSERLIAKNPTLATTETNKEMHDLVSEPAKLALKVKRRQRNTSHEHESSRALWRLSLLYRPMFEKAVGLAAKRKRERLIRLRDTLISLAWLYVAGWIGFLSGATATLIALISLARNRNTTPPWTMILALLLSGAMIPTIRLLKNAFLDRAIAAGLRLNSFDPHSPSTSPSIKAAQRLAPPKSRHRTSPTALHLTLDAASVPHQKVLADGWS